MVVKLKPMAPKLPSLEIYMVRDQCDISRIKLIRDYPFPDMDGAIAKCSHIEHTSRDIQCILVSFPDIMTTEPAHVTCTLVHEACHAWDFIKNHYGFTDDTELHAYSVESIFKQLYELYAEWMHEAGAA